MNAGNTKIKGIQNTLINDCSRYKRYGGLHCSCTIVPGRNSAVIGRKFRQNTAGGAVTVTVIVTARGTVIAGGPGRACGYRSKYCRDCDCHRGIAGDHDRRRNCGCDSDCRSLLRDRDMTGWVTVTTRRELNSDLRGASGGRSSECRKISLEGARILIIDYSYPSTGIYRAACTCSCILLVVVQTGCFTFWTESRVTQNKA